MANCTAGIRCNHSTTEAKHCLPVYVILHQWVSQQRSNNNKLYLWFILLHSVLKHGNTWIDELMLWRLKTECCIIRWLCKGSAVSSYCHTDEGWLNDGQEWWQSSRVRGEFILWPQGGTKDKGSECTQKEYRHLTTQLFSMPIQLSHPSIQCHYKPNFALMYWILG